MCCLRLLQADWGGGAPLLPDPNMFISEDLPLPGTSWPLPLSRRKEESLQLQILKSLHPEDSWKANCAQQKLPLFTPWHKNACGGSGSQEAHRWQPGIPANCVSPQPLCWASSAPVGCCPLGLWSVRLLRPPVLDAVSTDLMLLRFLPAPC